MASSILFLVLNGDRQNNPPQYGLLPMIAGSIYATIGAKDS